ncbi:MAG: hypothetical protein M1817_003568 [Caeruleum heppii]|nr:MAG: hypothetical protein M1817_003568 [Caeruleum heppii]
MIASRLGRSHGPLRIAHELRSRIVTPVSQSRHLHNVPPLTHGTSFQENGVPSLLSRDGFDIAWTQYQAHMVDNLNRLTQGTSDENTATKHLLLTHARQPDKAALFNYASMAHNNHFFFNCLSPKDTDMSSQLNSDLSRDFSSVDTLRREFIATANAMFGPGFVWLVKTRDLGTTFRLLTTYLAGSPYPGAHYRRQSVNMTTQNQDSAKKLSQADFERQNNVQNAVGTFGPTSKQPELGAGGIDLMPVLCVNTWEHVWLRDYGVRGKMEYLEAWWNRIDWGVVGNNADAALGRRR